MKANGKKFKKPMNKKRYYQTVLILSFITRLVNITAMNDEIVIGNKMFCSRDYRAIDFKISIDR